jgi:hypothetical protein
MKKIVIFKNSKYDGAFSARLGIRYLYINPPGFGGAGLSWFKSRCAAMDTIESCERMIHDWVEQRWVKHYEIIYPID